MHVHTAAHQDGRPRDRATPLRDALHRARVRDVQGERQGARVRAHAAPGAVVAERGAAPQAQDHGESRVHASRIRRTSRTHLLGVMSAGAARAGCSRSCWLKLLLLKCALSILRVWLRALIYNPLYSCFRFTDFVVARNTTDARPPRYADQRPCIWKF